MLTQQRCTELFIIVKGKLHWRIDATHSARMNHVETRQGICREQINIDGTVWSRKFVTHVLKRGTYPKGIQHLEVSLGRIPESLKEAA